jgi:hypothetical protein
MMSLPGEISTNLGLPATPFVTDPEMFSEFTKVYNAVRNLAKSLDAYTGIVGEEQAYWGEAGTTRCTIGLNSKIYVTAGETISYGSLVGIKSDGKAWKGQDGVVKCIGFSTAVSDVTAGSPVEIQLIGMFPTLPAATLTAGSFYYQSSTAGLIGLSGSAPTWGQIVGFAISDTKLFFNPQY